MTTYPVRFPTQLRQHLRALRKSRGLTQKNVAALIGVSQARIAEIEANPGLVSFEQLMQLLAALGVTITLCESNSLSHDTDVSNVPSEASNIDLLRTANSASDALRKAHEELSVSSSYRNILDRSKKGSW